MTFEDLLEIEEIKRVKNLYADLYDGGRVEEALELFTDDAVCEFGPKYGNWNGKAEIRAKYSGIWENARANGGKPYEFMHAFTNPLITLTGPDTARGRWYLLEFTSRVGEDSPPRTFGLYYDDYRKEDGQWKIARSRFNYLWPIREYKEEAAE